MEELIRNAWLQAGALGLLAFSGWFIWYQEHKERIKLQDKYDSLLEKLLVFMNAQKDTVDKLAEGLSMQEILRDELNKYSSRDKYEREHR